MSDVIGPDICFDGYVARAEADEHLRGADREDGDGTSWRWESGKRVPLCPVCGEVSRFAADIYVGDILIQRGCWCSEECAGADHDNHVRVDKVVDESSFLAVLAARPCWCGMAEHTVIDFCPRHGGEIK